MIIVKEIINFGGVCPFQVEAKTDKGEELYARYRWGKLRIEITHADGEREIVFAKQIGEDQNDEEEIAKYRASGISEDRITQMAETFRRMREFGNGDPLSFDGFMDMKKLQENTEGIIEWPAYEEE